MVERTGGNRRILLAGAAVVAVALVWGVTRWASEPVYVTLYRDLEFSDVARVEKVLDDAGVPHRLGPEGNEILVPVSQAPQARVAVAEDGHPVGGRPGLELFDKPSWGMTDFAQRVTYQRALEGELARTILAIRGIERAQVHLALPAPSVVRSDEQNARASVVLTVDPGTTLGPEAIQGIVYVVSNSVEQLSPDNVAVMDDAGRLLSVPATGGSQGAHSGRHMEMQRSVEEALAAKIQNLLEPVLGPDRVRAQVTAELSFEKVDRTIETVGPAATAAAESLGTRGAIPGTTQGSKSHEYQRREGSVGGVTRLTAAVLVDQAALKSGGEGGDAKPALDLNRIEAMVADAIGIDKERGDRLSVVAVPFEAATAPAGAGTAASAEGGSSIMTLLERSVRPLVGLIAVVVIGLLALKSLRLPAPAPPAASRAGATPALNAPETAPGPAAAPAREPAPAGPPEPNLQVVRGWLNEG
jgi:flagellar M-ring protein FliF